MDPVVVVLLVNREINPEEAANSITTRSSHHSLVQTNKQTNKHTYSHIAFVFNVAAQRNPFKNQRRLTHSEPPLPRHPRRPIQKHPSLAHNGSHLHWDCEPSCAKSSRRLTESPSQIFFYVRSPHVSVRRSRAAGQQGEVKDKEVSEHDKQSAGRGEGVDSSFDMQNGLAGNLLTGSHKPVLRGHSPPPPPRPPPFKDKVHCDDKKEKKRGQDNGATYREARMSCQDSRGDTSV